MGADSVQRALRLPHRPPMRLVGESAVVEGEHARCRGLIPSDCPGVDGDGAPAILGLEMGAQAASAFAGLDAPSPGADKIGVLVLIRRADLATRSLPVETPMAVEVRRAGSAGGLQLIEVTVTKEDSPGEVLVSGQIGTTLADRPPSPS